VWVRDVRILEFCICVHRTKPSSSCICNRIRVRTASNSDNVKNYLDPRASPNQCGMCKNHKCEQKFVYYFYWGKGKACCARRGIDRVLISVSVAIEPASATPDLRLPSQLRGITALWPVPNYRPTDGWTDAHVNESSRERKFLGTKVSPMELRGNESSAIRLHVGLRDWLWQQLLCHKMSIVRIICIVQCLIIKLTFTHTDSGIIKKSKTIVPPPP